MAKWSYKHFIITATALTVLAGTLVYLRPVKGQKSVSEPVVSTSETVLANNTWVVYVPVDKMPLSQAEREQLRVQIDNWQRTGSTSAGLLTTEFKKATHAKMTYRFGRRQKLSFKPVSLKNHLPEGFVLTGRQYEGEAGEQGFYGLYRLFENPTNKARLEVSEQQIHKPPLYLPSELFAQLIDGVPVRFETLSDKDGVAYYHAQFVIKDSHISMTAKGMTMTEFLSVIGQILKQAK